MGPQDNHANWEVSFINDCTLVVYIKSHQVQRSVQEATQSVMIWL